MLTTPNTTTIQKHEHDSQSGGGEDCVVVLGATQLVLNSTFASGASWTTDTGWTIGSGVATKTASNSNVLSQSGVLVAAGEYLTIFNVTAISAGAVKLVLGSSTAGTARTSTGRYAELITWDAGTDTIFVAPDASTFAGSVDNVEMYSMNEAMTDDYVVIDAIYWGFDATPAQGKVQILDSTGLLWSQDVVEDGPGQAIFRNGFYGAKNRPLIVVFDDLGGITGSQLTVSYR